MEMTDSKFMSADEKRKVLKQWITFLKHGLKMDHFTKPLYSHLIQHCSFIAHYDRGGFYATYFQNGDDTRRFLTQFDGSGPCESIEYGDQYWRRGEYQDINSAMIEAASPFVATLSKKSNDAQREADVSTAQALLRKHGMEVK